MEPMFSRRMFAPCSPCLPPPGSYLVPKPTRVGEARMQNWDGDHARSSMFTNALTVMEGRWRDELIFSTDVDAGM